MGRFASTVEFYTRYREPYCPEFFRTVAERLALRGDEALLDIGCGPAPLAIGFAPFMASTTGLDPEPAMIEAAKEAAEQAGAPLTLRLGRIEDFSAGELFDIVTIGRALHWLDRGPRWKCSNESFPGMGGC
jgi:2-polyprenyl-3-methyl-5-hydroxy-6-metoxy-1,4-benzoquinol methylase